MTQKHYPQQPKHAIENNLIKKFHQNPNLLKLVNTFPEPVFRYTLLKYWGFSHELNHEEYLFSPHKWRNIEPNTHAIDVTNHA